MPTWGEILAELTQSAPANGGVPDYDGVRRRYLKALNAHTGRDTIIYYSNWLRGSGPGITLEDMQGLMEVCRGLKTGVVDVILHSPGGSAEATASIVRYLRRQFPVMRVFVPLAAMSAATMWTLAADRVVMGSHSQLGPIDPQLLTPQGAIPARAIIEQFKRAQKECANDPSLLGAWLPILQQYGPALLDQCESAEKLSRDLVREWLRTYMFRGDPKATAKATSAARYFGSYSIHRSHSLGIDRDQARAKGIVVDDLESDQTLQDLVLSVHHATLHTFAAPPIKIVENHLGRAWVQSQASIPLGLPMGIPQQMPPMGLPNQPPAPPLEPDF